MNILGIDVGGSGIKGAIVNVKKGTLTSERYRIPTPKPSTPKAVAKCIKEMLQHFEWEGPVGLSFPTVVENGRSLSAGNIGEEWRNFELEALMKSVCQQDFYAINDADAAGIAEMALGAGKGQQGLVMTITIGTGLGSGVFFNGQLIPNFELGRIFGKNGAPIEFYAADSARKREELSFKKWAKRFDFFLNHLVRISRPNYIILGGGASKKLDKFKKHLTIDTPLVAAKYQNNAGIVGAALYAKSQTQIASK